jgi:hypothetical protein
VGAVMSKFKLFLEKISGFFSAELLLFLLFLLHLYFSWPGIMQPDSISQYAQAVSGVYDDHHPALMAFVWRYLDYMHKGPGLILVLNLLLLYSSVYFLIKSTVNKKIKYLLLLIPVIPNILLYSGHILKDVNFTFCFLFVNCYLAYISVHKKLLGIFGSLGLFIILLYGTAIKFQAQYLAIITLFWFALIFNNYKINYKIFLKFIAIIFIFYYVLISINNYLVPKKSKSEAWQFVKMYDIAAISIAINKDLLPDFIKLPEYSEKEMQTRFHYKSVDPLVFGDSKIGQKPILHKTYDEIQLKELINIWRNAVLSHPLCYLKHRMFNLGYSLFSRVGFGHIVDSAIFHKFFPEGTLTYNIVGVLGYIFLASFIPVLLAFIYLILAIYCLCRSINIEYAMPLLFFNSIAVSMVMIIFFFSMAGTPRYVYISVCMLHASHLFAYECFKRIKNK